MAIPFSDREFQALLTDLGPHYRVNHTAQATARAALSGNPTYLGKYRVDELKIMLSHLSLKMQRTLRKSGRKSELIDRIVETVEYLNNPQRSHGASHSGSVSGSSAGASYNAARRPAVAGNRGMVVSAPRPSGVETASPPMEDTCLYYLSPYETVVQKLLSTAMNTDQRYWSTESCFVLTEPQAQQLQQHATTGMVVNLHLFLSEGKPVWWLDEYTITVNNQTVQVKPTRRPKSSGHRTAVAIDISRHCVAGRNRLRVSLLRTICEYQYYISMPSNSMYGHTRPFPGRLMVNLSRMQGVDSVVANVLARCKMPALQTMRENAGEMYRQHMEARRGGSTKAAESANAEDDDEEELTEEKATIVLRCPLSMSRIFIPVRGPGCTHWQTFDLRSYLEYSAVSAVWQCPICKKSAPANKLKVDEHLYYVANRVRETVMSVTIQPNGDITELEEDDDDDETAASAAAGSPKPGSALTSPRKGHAGSAATPQPDDWSAPVAAIEILDSDDEDDTAAHPPARPPPSPSTLPLASPAPQPSGSTAAGTSSTANASASANTSSAISGMSGSGSGSDAVPSALLRAAMGPSPVNVFPDFPLSLLGPDLPALAPADPLPNPTSTSAANPTSTSTSTSTSKSPHPQNGRNHSPTVATNSPRTGTISPTFGTNSPTFGANSHRTGNNSPTFGTSAHRTGNNLSAYANNLPITDSELPLWNSSSSSSRKHSFAANNSNYNSGSESEREPARKRLRKMSEVVGRERESGRAVESIIVIDSSDEES